MAPRKKAVDQKAAKEKKQKKIAAGGALLLVILMVVQVPRTMKMLDDGAAATPAATTPAATTAAPGAAPPAAGAPVDGTLAPPTLEGANPTGPTGGAAANGAAQLVSFSQFESKDPFAQQVDPELVAPAQQNESEPAKESAATPKAPQPSAGAVGGSERGSTPSPTPAAPRNAQIAINGVEEPVAVDGTFPQASPMFVLVSLTAKSAKIKVAEGGSFAAGDAVLTLELKKPVTLVNTADGARFVIELRSVA